eukprot:g1814.t1
MSSSDASKVSDQSETPDDGSTNVTSDSSSSLDSEASVSDASGDADSNYSNSSSPEGKAPRVVQRKQQHKRKRQNRKYPKDTRKKRRSSNIVNSSTSKFPRPLKIALSIRSDKKNGLNYNLLFEAQPFLYRDAEGKPSFYENTSYDDLCEGLLEIAQLIEISDDIMGIDLEWRSELYVKADPSSKRRAVIAGNIIVDNTATAFENNMLNVRSLHPQNENGLLECMLLYKESSMKRFRKNLRKKANNAHMAATNANPSAQRAAQTPLHIILKLAKKPVREISEGLYQWIKTPISFYSPFTITITDLWDSVEREWDVDGIRQVLYGENNVRATALRQGLSGTGNAPSAGHVLNLVEGSTLFYRTGGRKTAMPLNSTEKLIAALGDPNEKKWKVIKDTSSSSIVKKELTIILGWGKGEADDMSRDDKVEGSQEENQVLAKAKTPKKPRTQQGALLTAAHNHRKEIEEYFVEKFRPGSGSRYEQSMNRGHLAIIAQHLAIGANWSIWEKKGAESDHVANIISNIPWAAPHFVKMAGPKPPERGIYSNENTMPESPSTKSPGTGARTIDDAASSVSDKGLADAARIAAAADIKIALLAQSGKIEGTLLNLRNRLLKHLFAAYNAVTRIYFDTSTKPPQRLLSRRPDSHRATVGNVCDEIASLFDVDGMMATRTFLKELKSLEHLQNKSSDKWIELSSADTNHITLEEAADDIESWNRERINNESSHTLRADPAVVLLAAWIHDSQSESMWT